MLKPVHDHASGKPDTFKIEGLKEAKAAQAAEPIIALAMVKPQYAGQRSGHAFNLEVNGVPWARVNRESRGRYGYLYTFEQIGGQTISRSYKKRYKSDPGWREVIIHGASMKEKRHAAVADERSTEQRLIDEAKALIAQGLMKHPDVQAAEVKARREQFAERQKEAEAEKKESFRQRAAACLPGGALPNEAENTATIGKIIEAMEWAQSQ